MVGNPKKADIDTGVTSLSLQGINAAMKGLEANKLPGIANERQ